MTRIRLRLFAAVTTAMLIGASAAAAASSTRSQRSVAGVRAMLGEYASDILSGNARGACGLLTSSAQRQIARQNHASSCERVIEAAHALLKSDPGERSAVRTYARTAKVTVHGTTARATKLGGHGYVTLDYTNHLWYLASG